MEKTMKKACITQTVLIVLWSILALALAVLTVVELLPKGKEGLAVKEPLKVSSAPVLVGQQLYTSAISGTVANPTDEIIAVDRITVTVSDGDTRDRVQLTGFVLPPRAEQEIYFTWESTVEYDRIKRIEVTAGEDVSVLSNMPESAVAAPVVVYLILLAAVVLLLVRACKIRYYLWQESRL